MERYEQQFKKGILEMLVLKLISQKTAYGYDLILRLKDIGGGLFDLKEGTLYPVLYRLEDEGLIASRKEAAQSGGREKKLYDITDEGLKVVQGLKDYWNEFSRCVSGVMDVKEEKA